MFNLGSAVITETPQNELSTFQCYVLTLMKLWLNVSNYNLGFRFDISTSTVCWLIFFQMFLKTEDLMLQTVLLYFARGMSQLSPGNVEATHKLDNERIHVERIIGAVWQHFQILSAIGVLQKDVASKKGNRIIVLGSIVQVCCSLNNVCDGIIVPFN